MAQKVILIASFVILLSFFMVPNHAACRDHLDDLMDACANGNQAACEEIDKLTEKYRVQVDALNAVADNFTNRASSLNIQSGKSPNLKKAYPLILQDYISSKAVDPLHKRQGISPLLVSQCSEQFHDLFINQRLSWPTDSSGQPDWGIIYLQVIEHYFRHCSNQ